MDKDSDSFKKKRDEFLRHYIFGPRLLELSEDYEEILCSLNVWPKGVFMEAQKQNFLKKPTFWLGRTQVKTKQPVTKMTFTNDNVVELGTK